MHLSIKQQSFRSNFKAQPPSCRLSYVNLVKVKRLAWQMRKGTLVTVLTEGDSHTCGEIKVIA